MRKIIGKTKKRLISSILSVTMIFSLMSTSMAYAVQANDSKQTAYKVDISGKDKLENVEDIFRQTIGESRKNSSVSVDENVPKAEDKVTFIVEVEEPSAKELCGDDNLENASKDTGINSRVLNSQEKYIKSILTMDKNAEITNRYTLVFNGFSVETQFKYKSELEKIHGIKKVSLSKTYYRSVKNAVETGQISEVMKSYGYNGEGMVISVIDSGVDVGHKDMVLSQGTKVKLTKEAVDKIKSNQKNKRGKFYSKKVPFAYNYVDKNDEIIDTIKDSIEYAHGMHVAGIVAANCQSEDDINNNRGVKGVAPESQILAMKIFSNNPDKAGADEGDIIAAIEDSIAYGADVINMSFCMSAGFQDPEDGQQKAIKAATEQGIVVVAAAGNAYSSIYPKEDLSVVDTGTVGSPALASETIQVASIENSMKAAHLMDVVSLKDSTKIAIPYVYSDFNPDMLKSSYEIVYCGLGKASDFDGKDVYGKIALIKRGENEFKDKKLNAQAKGAVGTIIFNKDGDEEYVENLSTDKTVKIPTAFIKNSDGVKLKELAESGLRVQFTGKGTFVRNLDGNNMSIFSSWGPTPNLELKPDITGIGGKVWSTINHDSYKSMSGTSMASPYTAGISALILQHLEKLNIEFKSGTEKVKYVKTMLMNTADIQKEASKNQPYSPRLQGAGLVNIKNALSNKSLLTWQGKASASLKLINNNQPILLKLYNGDSKDVTYNINVKSNEANINFSKAKLLNDENKNILAESSGEIFEDVIGQPVPLTGGNITVPAGKTVLIQGNISFTSNVKPNSFVEGFISFIPNAIADDGDKACEISIPFMGFYGDWGSLPIIDKPIYEEGSVFKHTSLYTVDNSGFIAKTYPLGGDDIGQINPQYFSINPDDKKSKDDVMPQFSLLRNAKKLVIDVTDSNGKVIKTIEDKENVRKEVPMEQQISAKVNFDWMWNGKIYDKNLGEKVSVDEGQYYVNIRATADFNGAEEQVLTLPLKIDKTVPAVSAQVIDMKDSKCTLEIDARDLGTVDSGIEHFVFMVNGNKYVDSNGKSVFKLEKQENGKYKMDLTVPKGEEHTIYVGVTDYADNMKAVQVKASSSDVKPGDKPNENPDEPNINPDVYIDKNRNIVVEHLTKVDKIANGQDVVYKIAVTNKGDKPQKVTLICGIYDMENRLEDLATVEKIVQPGKKAYLTVSVKVPDKGDYKMKAFVWDAISGDKTYPLGKMRVASTK
ncbi:lactocepin [Hathewaya proteolytica DSM 3090]|uniref:Lactocepin n=1 Tax=Hathewaya proteolytica DSM 3090 TaxID=1121331 RepID=A0A1M6PKS6_9CLOT|nr:S8 family serine peptidase [Hathewaya proteolytica]SHK08521.1 lactocepin [Hathewaya proteolytica DSM 3090]